MFKINKKIIIISCASLLGLSALFGVAALWLSNSNLRNEVQVLYQQVESRDAIQSDYDQSLLQVHALEKQVKTIESQHIGINKENEALQAECNRLNGLLNQPASEESNNIFDPEKVFDKVVYLTFDDGPSYNTVRILKILRRNHVKATFFVNQTLYGEENNVYKQIVDAGHAIGNHTYHHLHADEDVDAFYEDFMLMDDYIYQKTGAHTKLFRFPGGSSDEWEDNPKLVECIDKLTNDGYIYFDWNVSNNDSRSGYDELNAADLVEYVEINNKGRNPAVVLMHDRSSNDATVEALPKIIDYYHRKGYTFLPLHSNAYTAAFYNGDDEQVDATDDGKSSTESDDSADASSSAGEETTTDNDD